MADIADVCLALGTLISAQVYPNGTGSASSITGLTGKCAIFQNWPIPADIDNRVIKGNDVLIAVVDSGTARSTKRYPVVDVATGTTPITLTWTVSGNTATIGGTVTTPQNLAIEINTASGQAAYAYGVKSNDTLATIATAMAALIPGASAVGAVITIPSAKSITARVGGFVTTIKETGRQMTRMMVSVWAPTDALRQAALKVIRGYLDDLRRFALAEGTGAMITGGFEVRDPGPTKLGLAHTNLTYQVEFPSTVTSLNPQAIAWVVTVQGSAAAQSQITGSSPPPFTFIY